MNVTECVISCALLRYATPCYTLPTASKSHRSKQLLRSPPRFSGRGSQHPAALPKEQQSRYLGVWGGCIESALIHAVLHDANMMLQYAACCMSPGRMLGASWESVHQFKHIQTSNSSHFSHFMPTFSSGGLKEA